MQRYFLELSYKGTNYHGWQVQPNAISVQQVMDEKLSVLLREKIAVTGAGRTDTGVHASFFVLHFDSEHSDLGHDLVHKLNSFLPPDIAAKRLLKVKQDAHARFDAISRTYQYFIETIKNPFTLETAWKYTQDLDAGKMNAAASDLLGTHDFTSFSRLHTDVKTNICTVHHARWERHAGQLVFTIKADRFLRNMVRAIVGTLVEVGKGAITEDGFRKIINLHDRSAAGPSAPAHGLFLTGIEYPENIFKPS